MPTVRPKGLKEILAENKTLSQKITYEEYEAGKTIPKNSDETIEAAYANYQKVKSGEM